MYQRLFIPIVSRIVANGRSKRISKVVDKFSGKFLNHIKFIKFQKESNFFEEGFVDILSNTSLLTIIKRLYNFANEKVERIERKESWKMNRYFKQFISEFMF